MGGPFLLACPCRADGPGVTLSACSGASSATPPNVSAQPLPLSRELQAEPHVGHLDLTAAFVLSTHDPHFGGLSGLLVEGQQLLALSDRAWLWQATLQFDGEGTLVGLAAGRDQPDRRPGARRHGSVAPAAGRLSHGRRRGAGQGALALGTVPAPANF